METSRVPITNLCILGLYLCVAAISFTHCDARRPMQLFKGPTHPRSSIVRTTKKIKVLKRFDMDLPLDSSNSQPYGVSSPFSLPPYDSLAPIPLPENTPPFCLYPPFTPQPPSTTIPTPSTGGGYTPTPSTPPTLPIQSPPSSPGGGIVPSPPEIVPNPPSNVPGPPEYIPNPPIISVPSPTQPVLSPPYKEPSPPTHTPNPKNPSPSTGTGFSPSPPIFLPPVVYPPPTGPPPPHTSPSIPLWCVAKPSVPEPIIQEAMNYACGSGADCDSILPNGSCFEPNTVIAHASYAFNSYWQRTRVAGGTCEFGGAAMLVSVDPSNDGCHFIYY
uniref:X8 domain-containing protein n=1 Tax=Davidia involucrata TaxID=16924 RepID=A0A5B6ZM48_DAVIN